MTHACDHEGLPARTPLPRIGHALTRAVLRIAARHRLGRDIALLQSMSDHHLRDIGLTRDGIRDAVAPEGMDPLDAFGGRGRG
ncbi:hypothetical protein HKCCE2091_03170 [Rhodobacterales bacterium HKCCE2091]|nr:hypothetical protein [Rhodobacterales bacterium HKCCE2091]